VAPSADPRLDRLPRRDERSRAFPARTLTIGKRRRSYTWRCPVVLDQGGEGACVGFAWAHEAAARPAPVPGISQADALATYNRARDLDEFPPGTEGSSVLAGAKAATENGWVVEYRWTLGPGVAAAEQDLALSVGYTGPAVAGINWYESMYEPRDGWVTLDGELVGGHAILINGYSVKLDAYRLHNSWGPGWGVNGEAWISRADMARLLDEDGEACVPCVRAVPDDS